MPSAIRRRSSRRPRTPTSLYVAGSRITNGQGILVPANSAIRSIADLKGKRVGFTKGSSAHNVVIATLEKAGLTYEDITPVYLTPPDAGPAFANGSIDAWAVWDPYFAIGEKRQSGRILVNAHEVAKTNSFYLANRDFANTYVQRNPRGDRRAGRGCALGGGQSYRGRQRARGDHRRAA